MKVYAIRGATTVACDTREEIIAKTTELISEIVKKNGLLGENFSTVSVIASNTNDIHSYYPARAIRESKIIDAPLFSSTEPDIEGAMPLCIRIMVTVCDSEGTARAKHVYLHGAASLRPDLTEKH